MASKIKTRKRLITTDYPHYIKYMGSKSGIMDFVIEGINEVYDGGMVCDLFAGSCSLAGAIGRQVAVHSNDIQQYSTVLADCYLNSYAYRDFPDAQYILKKAAAKHSRVSDKLDLNISYAGVSSLAEFNNLEKMQQELVDRKFQHRFHLFLKNYSGTWWTADQCIWIDAIREVAEEFRDTPAFSYILSCLMYAMAYTSQGTGHYAQYRDAKTKSSMKDISIYRKRSVAFYFEKKYASALPSLPTSEIKLKHKISGLDYVDALDQFSGGTVYADPPYCFVHYSRFYHAIETLTLYDYPELQVKNGEIVKGRYRSERHQSPFCIRTQVKPAFERLFLGVQKTDSSLVLSYSNTGMITLDDLSEIAFDTLSPRYSLELITTNHLHMTLGRAKDRHREVEEGLLLAIKK